MRQSWVDSWKGILIFLVVLGHAVGGALHFSEGNVQLYYQHLFKIIYWFHMPAFFVLAGMMFHGGGEFFPFAKRKFKRLIIPYIVFGMASIAVFLLVHMEFERAAAATTTNFYADKLNLTWRGLVLGLVHGGGWPNGKGLQMNSVLWFLPCMFSSLMIFWGVSGFVQKKGWAVIAFVGLLLLDRIIYKSGVPVLPWGLIKVPRYLAYMIMGRAFLCAEPYPWVARHKWMVMGGLLVCASVYGKICSIPPNDVVWDLKLRWQIFSPLLAIIGIFGSVLAAQVLDCRLIAWVGRESMIIMLIHKFLLVPLQMKVPYVKGIVSQDALMGLLALILISGIICMLCGFAGRFVMKHCPWMLGGENG